MFEYFELCFISKLEPAYQGLIRQAFHEFYTGNP
jgi:hypothetical protein